MAVVLFFCLPSVAVQSFFCCLFVVRGLEEAEERKRRQKRQYEEDEMYKRVCCTCSIPCFGVCLTSRSISVSHIHTHNYIPDQGVKKVIGCGQETAALQELEEKRRREEDMCRQQELIEAADYERLYQVSRSKGEQSAFVCFA